MQVFMFLYKQICSTFQDCPRTSSLIILISLVVCSRFSMGNIHFQPCLFDVHNGHESSLYHFRTEFPVWIVNLESETGLLHGCYTIIYVQPCAFVIFGIISRLLCYIIYKCPNHLIQINITDKNQRKTTSWHKSSQIFGRRLPLGFILNN